MIEQIVVFSRKTDAQRKILRFVPQKLRKSFANGNPKCNKCWDLKNSFIETKIIKNNY